MSLEPVLFLFLRQGLVTAVLCRLLLIFLLLSPILLQECWDQHHIWPLSNLHSHAFMASTLPIEALSHLTHIPNCGGGEVERGAGRGRPMPEPKGGHQVAFSITFRLIYRRVSSLTWNLNPFNQIASQLVPEILLSLPLLLLASQVCMEAFPGCNEGAKI